MPPLTLENICLCVEQSEDTQELYGERFVRRQPSKLEDHSWGIVSSQLCAFKLKCVKIHQRIYLIYLIKYIKLSYEMKFTNKNLLQSH